MPARKWLTMPQLRELFAKTFANWSEDNVPRLAAAFSFYAILSLAPLLVLAVAGAARFLGEAGAREELMKHAKDALGSEAVPFLEGLIQKTGSGGQTAFATIASLAVTFFGASNLFLQLDDAVNTIWGIKQTGSMIRAMLMSRITAFLAVLVFGGLVVAWMGLDSFLAAQAHGFPGVRLISFAITIVFFVGAFAVSLKALPRNRISWGDVWPGAVVAAVGVALGKLALSQYFAFAKVSAAYGSAGALVVILLWIYYTSQIYFFGVELTYTYALAHGSHKGKPAPGVQYS